MLQSATQMETESLDTSVQCCFPRGPDSLFSALLTLTHSFITQQESDDARV